MDPAVINGLALAIFLISVMLAPIYCCQVSDEEYERIVLQIKLQKEKVKEANIAKNPPFKEETQTN